MATVGVDRLSPMWSWQQEFARLFLLGVSAAPRLSEPPTGNDKTPKMDAIASQLRSGDTMRGRTQVCKGCE